MQSLKRVRALACVFVAFTAAGQAFAAKPSLQDQLIEEITSYDAKADPAANLKKIETLLNKGAKMDVLSREGGFHPFQIAIYANRADVVDLFIRRKYDVQQAFDSNGNTPLMYAMLQKNSQPEYLQNKRKIVASLLAAKANPNVVAGGANSPLHSAGGGMYPPDLVLMEMLLKAGADPNLDIGNGMTALFSGATGSLAALKLLLQAGADPHVVASNGLTPLHAVCERDLDDVIGTTYRPDPEAAERIKLLKHPERDLNAMPQHVGMKTPLALNVQYYNPDCIGALIAAGADVNGIAKHPEPNETGTMTVLEYARKYKVARGQVLEVLQQAASKAK
ncbi:hypothetical protein OOT46_27835 [Aquabacterium sp. A7-Y]|uniref:ankyrin repeat domain-containing protein n=1 Tax=Aquabacterium sp. A7-Y TaxID=1349605 RepID=UPI00223E09BD|nr:ankyrin repeat domain-containing protein [Aquabacterium sp. A7-Y]MCW7541617.1 hypothetical protein [Aquabacterium sp. A7-Y]